MRIVALAVLLSAGCGADCEPGDRDGTYLMESRTVSGDCGPQTSSLVRIDAGDQELGPGCSLDSADEWTEDSCTLTREMTCVNSVDGYSVKGLAVTEQSDSDGALLEGTLTMTVRELSTGDLICMGTYAITAKRQ